MPLQQDTPKQVTQEEWKLLSSHIERCCFFSLPLKKLLISSLRPVPLWQSYTQEVTESSSALRLGSSDTLYASMRMYKQLTKQATWIFYKGVQMNVPGWMFG